MPITRDSLRLFEVDTSHAVALSCPAAVAEQILNVAIATRA
jgi:hypothetical protein